MPSDGIQFELKAPDGIDFTPDPTVRDEVVHAVGAGGRAAAGTLASVPDFIARMAQATDRRLPDALSFLRSDSVQTPGQGYQTAKWAQAVRDAADKILPSEDPRLADSFWLTDVPGAVGTGAAMVGTGGAVGLATRSGAAAVGAGNLLGFTGEFDDAFDRATRAGQGPDEALARSLGYATVATLIENKLGAGRLLRRYFPSADAALSKLTARGVTTTLLKDLGAGFVEEASQRIAQNAIVGGQLSAEGAGREGAAGAVAQALLGLPGAMAHGRRHAQHGRALAQSAIEEPLPALEDLPEALVPTAQLEDDFRFDMPAAAEEATATPEPPAPAVEAALPENDTGTPPESAPSTVVETTPATEGGETHGTQEGIGSADQGVLNPEIPPNTEPAPNELAAPDSVTPPVAQASPEAPEVTSQSASTETTPAVSETPATESALPAATAETAASSSSVSDLAPISDWQPLYDEVKGRTVTVMVQNGDVEEPRQMPANRLLKRQRSLIEVLDRIRDCLT